jgi:hypothetical protein
MHYHIIGWKFLEEGATVYCEVGLCRRKQNLKASKISSPQQIVLLIPELIPPYAFMALCLISLAHWLRAVRPRGRSLSPGRFKNMLFSTLS